MSAESSSEVDRLRAWKAEAMAVLDEWERTCDRLIDAAERALTMRAANDLVSPSSTTCSDSDVPAAPLHPAVP